MRKKRMKELIRCHKKKVTTKERKARNHLKLFLNKKSTPHWELLLEEYKLQRLYT